MDIPTLINAVQASLSVVGFIALSIWMMKWAKGLHERSKELGELDKEIRAVMKDTYVAQKELHEVEQKKLETELSNVLSEMKKNAKALHTQTEIAQAAISTIEIVSKLASLIQRGSVINESSRINEHFQRIIEILVDSKIVRKEKAIDLWKDRASNKSTFSSNEEEILWRLTDIHLEPWRMEAIADSILLIAPKAFEFFLKNPKATEQETKSFVSSFLKQQAENL
ncbi:MAG: hypothetical protein ACOY9D_11055 [Pseudomonadota bacterium]